MFVLVSTRNNRRLFYSAQGIATAVPPVWSNQDHSVVNLMASICIFWQNVFFVGGPFAHGVGDSSVFEAWPWYRSVTRYVLVTPLFLLMPGIDTLLKKIVYNSQYLYFIYVGLVLMLRVRVCVCVCVHVILLTLICPYQYSCPIYIANLSS